jgi:hypothetical protein
MDDIMASNQVANDNQLGYLVLLKSWKIDLKGINPSSNYALRLSIMIWGFVCLPMVVSGFGCVQVPS